MIEYIFGVLLASLFLGLFLYSGGLKKQQKRDASSSSSVEIQNDYVKSSVYGNSVNGGGDIDVIIVGAGVAGAALAYTLGKDGRRVQVIERDLNEPDRIVGELLQPGGYLKLIELGLQDCVEEIDAQRVLGYALFKDGKNTKLSYPLEKFHSDVSGRSFHNGRFIQRMREKAASISNVRLDQGTVTSLLEENGTIKGVSYKSKAGEELKAYAPLTIVCDGCFSNLRRSLCSPKVEVPSCFVGLILENCELPHPNHGHVVLADPSPILFYPISSTEVRCLVDVPGQKVPSIASGEMANYLKTMVAPQIPHELYDSFIKAVEKGSIRTMPNRSMPAAPHPNRFSDPVTGVLPVDDLPEKGSLEYYKKMVHHDRLIRGRGRGLAGTRDETLTFVDGNETESIGFFGYLYYANVSLGTPGKSFLVALDTGSNLLWVPCDCQSCAKELNTSRGVLVLNFNIYSPNASSTSKSVPCDGSLCESRRDCSGTPSTCPYEIKYVSDNTSSSGILVEDVLHLITEEKNPAVVNADITFGCGQTQTGSLLDGAAPNGLFGLGMDKSSVPSILSSAGLAANSFSMCFGSDLSGRISFGDKGSPNQEETPLNLNQLQKTFYNISMTEIMVGTYQSNVEFSAIFDSGTSFTSLSDPLYTLVCEAFDSQAQDKRHSSDASIPFEYCYDISPNQNSIVIPNMTLIMKGGSQFPLLNSIALVSQSIYCLGVAKSPNVNIIGQNFMTGYRVVFNREKMVLGWKESNCYDIQDSSTMPVNPPKSVVVPPATAVEPRTYTPEATKNFGSGSYIAGAPSPIFYIINCILMMLFLPILAVRRV